MTPQKSTIPAPGETIVLDGVRIEVSLVDDQIWVSSYEGKEHYFTVVLPRRPLVGCDDAKDSVKADALRGNRKMASRMANEARAKFKVAAPKAAGFWYHDPSFPNHGGPVTIVEE